jgi:hypothetical protein
MILKRLVNDIVQSMVQEEWKEVLIDHGNHFTSATVDTIKN